MLKFLHLICGATFFGIVIAAFFYVARSINSGDRSLIDYSIRTSYFGDGIVFCIVLIQIITAIKLISTGHFTLAIPWILIAHYAFAAIILLWLSILLIKVVYLTKANITPKAIRIFYLLNIIMILVFIIIIHDAVTQSTWFDFLLRKS